MSKEHTLVSNEIHGLYNPEDAYLVSGPEQGELPSAFIVLKHKDIEPLLKGLKTIGHETTEDFTATKINCAFKIKRESIVHEKDNAVLLPNGDIKASFVVGDVRFTHGNPTAATALASTNIGEDSIFKPAVTVYVGVEILPVDTVPVLLDCVNEYIQALDQHARLNMTSRWSDMDAYDVLGTNIFRSKQVSLALMGDVYWLASPADRDRHVTVSVHPGTSPMKVNDKEFTWPMVDQVIAAIGHRLYPLSSPVPQYQSKGALDTDRLLLQVLLDLLPNQLPSA